MRRVGAGVGWHEVDALVADEPELLAGGLQPQLGVVQPGAEAQEAQAVALVALRREVARAGFDALVGVANGPAELGA